MKRYLPFIIIALVGLSTLGIAAALYRSKTQPVAATPPPPASVAGTTSSPALVEEKKNEDEKLHVQGPRDAPVTLEMYGDFQCAPCAGAASVINGLEKQFAGKLRVVFHQFPLAMHRHALEAAMAAEAAGLQGHFWEMHDMLYQYQAVWSKADEVGRLFAAYAESLGLDVAQFERDARSPEVRERVISDGGSGTARGVKNTPTIFINGQEMRSPVGREDLQEKIETVLADGKKT